MGTSLAFLLSFRTYGTWLPGAPQGFIDRHHNLYGTPYRAGAVRLHTAMERLLVNDPVRLSGAMRTCCERSLRVSCEVRGWVLMESVVMREHCHLVVCCDVDPEDALRYVKARATLALKRGDYVARHDPVWSHGGSMLFLFDDPAVAMACQYVALHRVPDPSAER